MGRAARRRAVKWLVAAVLPAAVLLAAVAAGLHPAPAAAAPPPVRLAAPLLYPLGLDPFSLSVAETPTGEVYALAAGMDPSHVVADALYKVPLGIEGQDYVRVDRLTTAAQPRAGVLRDMDGDGLLEPWSRPRARSASTTGRGSRVPCGSSGRPRGRATRSCPATSTRTARSTSWASRPSAAPSPCTSGTVTGRSVSARATPTRSAT